jgi:hypothetical protein
VHITPHWLVMAGMTNLEVIRLCDIVWYYQRVTRDGYFGIVINKKHTLIVFNRLGRLMIFNGSEKQVASALEILAQRAPWAIGGYHVDLQIRWNTPQTRQSMIDVVDERRRRLPL